MNRYHIDLIVGGPAGIITNLITVEANGFHYTSAGFYEFYVYVGKDKDDEDKVNRLETIAMYPIARTVIRKIQKI